MVKVNAGILSGEELSAVGDGGSFVYITFHKVVAL
jgi:hypothetical protein